LGGLGHAGPQRLDAASPPRGRVVAGFVEQPPVGPDRWRSFERFPEQLDRSGSITPLAYQLGRELAQRGGLPRPVGVGVEPATGPVEGLVWAVSSIESAGDLQVVVGGSQVTIDEGNTSPSDDTVARDRQTRRPTGENTAL
jgi:hypothetical protein